MISLIRQFGSDLLGAFRALKGKKEKPSESQQPLPPLIQRLDLPGVPSGCRSIAERREFVMGVIRTVNGGRFAQRISKRVLGKITRHYGVDLYGYGLFRTISGRPNMLEVLTVQS